MVTVNLHIGQHKTGTTAIQFALDRNRDLLRGAGILYPEPRHVRECHHYLSALTFPPERLRQHVLNRMGYDPAICRNKAEAEGRSYDRQRDAVAGLRTVVFSSESLFQPITRQEGARLRESVTRPGDELHVLAYLRNPAAHYLSMLQQNLKWTREIPAYNPDLTLATIDSYRDVFGAALDCRAFSRLLLKEGDVVQDFCAWASIDTPLDSAGLETVNASVSAEAMSVLSRINPPRRARSHDEHRAELRRLALVTEADDIIPGATKPRFHDGLEEQLLAGTSILEKLGVGYGIVFPEVPANLPAARTPPVFRRLEDICPFDVARRNEIEARVNRTKAPFWLRGVRNIRTKLMAM